MKSYWCIDCSCPFDKVLTWWSCSGLDRLRFKLKLGQVCNVAFDCSVTISSGWPLFKLQLSSVMAHGFRGILQGQAKNSISYLLALCDTSLLFVDLYRIVLLRTLMCGGRGSGLSVGARCHQPTCVSALNPHCSLGFSPFGVCRLWNLICSGWGNVRGTLNGRRRKIKGKWKHMNQNTE